MFVSTRFSWASRSEARTGWSVPADITPPAHSAVIPRQRGGSSSSKSADGQTAHSVYSAIWEPWQSLSAILLNRVMLLQTLSLATGKIAMGFFGHRNLHL